MDQPEREASDIDSKGSLSFRIARLYAQLQVLGSGFMAAASAVALLGVSGPNQVRDRFGIPCLVASLAALAASVGFLFRSRWSRTFLLGECALIPPAVIAWLVWEGRYGLNRMDVLFMVALGVGSIMGAFAFNAKDVRGWCNRR